MAARESILIVDDEPNIRMAMKVALEREGYAVSEAYDGRDALRSIYADRPDLVLLDIMLPAMNGYDVTIKLREDERTRRLPIIMVTAKGQITDRIHGLDLGADDYISKPFDLRELVARVNAMLRRRAAEEEAPGQAPRTKPSAARFPTPAPDMTFETFVVGPSNREAYEAALAVAATPGKLFNPLFMYGDAGIGKSHLLAAIGNRVARDHGADKVMYASSELFHETVREAIMTHRIEGLLSSLGRYVVLLLDDVHFLTRARSQQDRTLEVFMELYDRARQVAVCSDRPPDQLNDLTEMIRTLFVRGKVVQLDVPTPYHRGRILRSVCERNGWDLPESALIYLARNLTANVRTLIGVAKRVAAESTLTGKPVSPEIIDEVIAQVHSIGRPTNL